MRTAWGVVAAALVVAAPAAVAAQEGAGPLAAVSHSGGGVSFQPIVSNEGMSLTVTGPGGFVRQQSFGAGAPPFFSLFDAAGAYLTDGLYTWELRATPSVSGGARRRMDAARASGAALSDEDLARLGLPPAESLVQSGHFRIQGGAVVSGGGIEPSGAPTASRAVTTEGDFTPKPTISGNLTVYNSLCVGFDCAANESYGADSIRLKENNLRIHFEDTSSTASFPTNDWRIVANDSINGGGSYLAFEDSSAGRQVFRVTANVPSNSLVVGSGGRIGLKTATPVVEIHSADGDTPTLRLEQNNSSGFTPQTWDVAGNEASFFVRDVTNGSTLPFRIRPGASSNSLFIDDDDNIGLGTSNPTEALHISRAAGASGEIKIKMVNSTTNTDWAFSVVDSGAIPGVFRISKQGTGGPEVEVRERLDAGGNATLKVDGSIEATNVTFSSSREAKTAITPLDTEALLARLASLSMAEWRYKTEADTARHMGPMAEDFNAAFGLTGNAETISVVDAQGIALATIQALNARVIELTQRLEALEAERAQP